MNPNEDSTSEQPRLVDKLTADENRFNNARQIARDNWLRMEGALAYINELREFLSKEETYEQK